VKGALASCLALLLAGAAWAAGPAPALPGASPLETALSGIERSAAGVNSLSALFTQERSLASFRHKLVSRGRFWFQRPDRLRWETTEPVAAGFALDGGKGRRWNETTGQREDISPGDPLAGAVAGQIMAWTTGDVPLLRRQYEISLLSSDPLVLRLTPRSEGMRRVIDRLEIAFAPDRSAVRTVAILERGGDSTRIAFFGAEINPSLPDGLF